MPRALWKGSLSFGLVNVPVKVVTATRSQDVRFHMLHDADGARIVQKRVCSADGEEVPYEHVARGYEVGPDQYVVVSPDELEALDPEKSETIDIVDFVGLAEIDPIYYEKTYYLLPEKGGTKAYALLLEAMRKSDRVAIARVVMRTKEHLVAVRPIGNVLAMTTLLYHDEVVRAEELEGAPAEASAPKRELEMAERLIDALTTGFEPTRYEDEHRARVLSLIETKAQGREVVTPPRREPKGPTDLASALEASLAAATKRKPRDEGVEA